MSAGPNGSESAALVAAGEASIVMTQESSVVADPVTRVLQRVAAVDEIIAQLMKEGTHYGKIPGCPKLSLWQPGAEDLAMAFQLRPRFEFQINDNPFGHQGHREVICTCRIEGADGQVLTEAFGSCSTLESKYRWRSGTPCPECGGKLRRSKRGGPPWYCWAVKGGCGWQGTVPDGTEQRHENPDLADEFHTVLAMARKRALVLAVKTVLAASDRFTEGDDDHQRRRDSASPAEPEGAPWAGEAPWPDHDQAPPPPRYLTKQEAWSRIKPAMQGRTVYPEDVANHLRQAKLSPEKLTAADVEKVVRWVKSRPAKPKPAAVVAGTTVAWQRTSPPMTADEIRAAAGLVPAETIKTILERLAATKGDLGARATLSDLAARCDVEEYTAWPASKAADLLRGIEEHVAESDFEEIGERLGVTAEELEAFAEDEEALPC